MGDAALDALLSSVGASEDPLDPDIRQYILSIAEDPDPESSLDVLVSLLAEMVAPFAALSSDSQAELVLQMLDAQACSQQPSSSTTTAAQQQQQQHDEAGSSLSAVVAALRQTKLQSEELPDACADITNSSSQRHASTGSHGSNDSSSDSDACRPQQPDVGPLMALCPDGVGSQFLQHCVQHNCQGDLQVAANWLLEADPQQLLRQQAAWQQDQQRREQERREAELHQKQQKKLIVEKFDLRVVSDGGSGAAKKGSRQQAQDLLQVPKKAQQQESKLRYRDGRVVSTKGEKIIVEKVGEDWDGGSRGKVFTKGKRGKGFH